MESLFSGCTSLIKVPDLSKWNSEKIDYMNYMFADCFSLANIPDISKWVKNKRNTFGIFNNCFCSIVPNNIIQYVNQCD